jgi:hypothetical protein
VPVHSDVAARFHYLDGLASLAEAHGDPALIGPNESVSAVMSRKGQLTCGQMLTGGCSVTFGPPRELVGA